MNSTTGLIGKQVEMQPESERTIQLLDRGIIAELKIVAPSQIETKVVKDSVASTNGNESKSFNLTSGSKNSASKPMRTKRQTKKAQ